MKTKQILTAMLSVNFLLGSCGKAELARELDELSRQKSVAADGGAEDGQVPGSMPAVPPAAQETPAGQVAVAELPATSLPEPPAAASSSPVADTAGTIPMLNVPTFNYVNVLPNSQPLFSKSCLLEKNPGQCSSLLLQKWLHRNLQHLALDGIQEGPSVEYISFTIDKHGNVANVKHAGTKGAANEERARAALEAVRKMPGWQPATRNGRQVNVSMVLPVRFDMA